MTTGLLIPVYNRPEYLKRCLDSLKCVEFPKDTVVLLIDDCSDSQETKDIMYSFDLPVELMKIERVKNGGIRRVLEHGYSILFNSYGCDYVVNLDSDAICKSNLITRLLELKAQHPDNIISGFNSRNTDNGKLRNPIISEHDGYALKQYANGINMLIDRKQYETLKPVLEKEGNWDFAISTLDKKPKVIAVPSLVQHIGLDSTMGHTNPDVACDFKILSLPNVTLFGIDAHDPKGIQRAADICRRDIEFGEVKIITERLFSGREAYSKFMIADLWEHVKDSDTTHVLTIHGDGFPVNPSAWDDEWLKLDFCGATWVFKDGLNVGNGGVSLRSKKFIEACSLLDIQDFHPEDCKLNRKYRPFMEKHFGLKWATEEQANRFSIEAYDCSMTDSSGIPSNQYCGSFAFHGYHTIGLPIQPVAKNAVNTLKRNTPHRR